MFSWLFGSKPKKKEEPQMDPRTAAIVEAIRERSKEDPLVGAKIGAKEIFNRLLETMKDEKGIHIESLLTALGALSGYSCQANLRAQALAKGMKETEFLQTVSTKNGKQYFFGDPLNETVAGAQYSVWGLSAGAAQQLGAKEYPDLEDIFKHVSSVLGTDGFGIPRVPEAHRAGALPIAYLKALWAPLLPVVKLCCEKPEHWPILYGLAIQDAIHFGKDVLDPSLAISIVMESAIPMSKVDLDNP